MRHIVRIVHDAVNGRAYRARHSQTVLLCRVCPSPVNIYLHSISQETYQAKEKGHKTAGDTNGIVITGIKEMQSYIAARLVPLGSSEVKYPLSSLFEPLDFSVLPSTNPGIGYRIWMEGSLHVLRENGPMVKLYEDVTMRGSRA